MAGQLQESSGGAQNKVSLANISETNTPSQSHVSTEVIYLGYLLGIIYFGKEGIQHISYFEWERLVFGSDPVGNKNAFLDSHNTTLQPTQMCMDLCMDVCVCLCTLHSFYGC